MKQSQTAFGGGLDLSSLDERHQSLSVYEVRCHSCDVSYPPGTKKCVHCGGRTGESRRRLVPSFQPEPGSLDFDGVPVADLGRLGLHLDDAREEVEEEAPTSSLPRMITGIAWILLVAVVSLYRACTG